MQLQDGKNIERLLAGAVKHPIDSLRAQEILTSKETRDRFRLAMGSMDRELSRVRNDQIEDPSSPKGFFRKNLLNDLDEKLGSLEDLTDGRYELRFYSSLDTGLDLLEGFDCWVEIFDTTLNKTIADFKIDLTINKDKRDHQERAKHHVYYFDDSKYLNDELSTKIDVKAFADREYKYLVDQAAASLKHQAENIILTLKNAA